MTSPASSPRERRTSASSPIGTLAAPAGIARLAHRQAGAQKERVRCGCAAAGRGAARLALVALMLVPLGGCLGAIVGAAAIGAAAGAASSTPRSPERAPATTTPVGASVQLRFVAPRDIDLTYIAASTEPRAGTVEPPATPDPSRPDSVVRVAHVASVAGRVRRVSADTVWIAVSEVRSRDRRLTYPLQAQPVHAIAATDAARLERLDSRPISAAVAAALGAAGAILLLVSLCDATGCYQ